MFCSCGNQLVACLISKQVEKWPTHLIEVANDGNGGGQIVWEWHIWDHLIQDTDPSKPNYGVVADNPQLIDINMISNFNF